MTVRRRPQAREVYWAFGCGLSAVIALACATFGTFLDIHLVARAQLYCLGDLGSGENFAGTGWALSRPGVLLLALTVAGSVAGPVAMTVYDLAGEGTPGDCVLPWWPTWLPS
ncbi:hypothetical protein [Nonomuraea sp. NPDC003214]